MELWGKDVDGWKVFHSNISHHDWIDSIDLVARVRVVVSASSQVVYYDFFDILENNYEIMSQKLDVFNFSLISIGEHNWRQLETTIVFNIVDKDLVGELIIDYSNQMSVLTWVNMESVGN